MAGTLDLLQTQRIVFLIDLHPIQNSNPNPYVSSVLSSARTLLTFPSLSSSLFAFKFFFSSLSPLLSSSKLHRLLGKSATSFSFDRPSETLISLSETLNSLSTLSDTLNSPPRASLTASSLHQLVHDYAWESQIQEDQIGTPKNFPPVRSNLILLFSPVPRSLKCLSEFMDVEMDDESLITIDAFHLKFQFFCTVKEGFVSRDIHLSWIDVNYELDCREEKVGRDKSVLGLGFLESGIKSLGWGFSSTDAIILGSALVPFGLIYPNIGCSLMGFSPNDCRMKVRAELSLEILDVSGRPLECKCCDLELLDLKMLPRQRYDNILRILESRNSSIGVCGQGKKLGDRNMKICVREVWRNDDSVKIELCDFFLLRGFVEESGKDKMGDTSGCFFGDRVLEMLRMETSEFTLGKPIWQLLLNFLHRGSYWALVSVSNEDGLPLMGILKPFTVHSALLCILDGGFLSDRFSSSLPQSVTKRDSELPKANSKSNHLDVLTDSQPGASPDKISASQDGKRKKNKKSSKLLQDLTWSSFCKAALNHSEMDLEDVYFSRDCNNSKKLRFLKCWMKQIKRSSRCSQIKPNELKRHPGIEEEMEQRFVGSQQESEQPVSSSFSTGEASFTGASNMNGDATPASCLETSEAFFSTISRKIQHGLESEEVDLGALAERLVNLSIYWLYQKQEMDNTMENPTPEERQEDVSGRTVAAELVKLLIREPKDLAAKYKGCDPTSLASDSNSAIFHAEDKIREYELQILFRMEILQSKVGGSIEETAKQKTVKQICSLLYIIQYHLAGGFFGDVSLDTYVGRTIRNRYSHSLEDVVRRIYTRMELQYDDEDGEASGSLFNSEDSDGPQRNKLQEKEIGGNARDIASTSAEDDSSQLQERNTESPQAVRDKEHVRQLMEAQGRRERARRFASFTSWVPDLQKVWAPKQLMAVKTKSDSLRKLPKRKERRGALYDMVCETPMTGNKRSCTQGSIRDEEKANVVNTCVSVSKALFQDDGDARASTIA